MLRGELRKEARAFAEADPEGFRAVNEQAFGDKAKDLSAELPQPANIRFVDRKTLNGSDAAYAKENGGTVFLAKDLKGNPEALQDAYREEVGHHIDHVLGGPDSAGDEGAIFGEGFKRKQALNAQELAKLKTENDHSVINVDGQTLEVENRFGVMDLFNTVTTIAGFIPGAGEAVGVASALANLATGNPVMAAMDIVGLIPGVGDAFSATGKLLVRGALGKPAVAAALKEITKHGPALRQGVQDVLNAMKRRGLLSTKQHRQLSDNFAQSMDQLSMSAKQQLGSNYRGTPVGERTLANGKQGTPRGEVDLMVGDNLITAKFADVRGKHNIFTEDNASDLAAAMKRSGVSDSQLLGRFSNPEAYGDLLSRAIQKAGPDALGTGQIRVPMGEVIGVDGRTGRAASDLILDRGTDGVWHLFPVS